MYVFCMKAVKICTKYNQCYRILRKPGTAIQIQNSKYEICYLEFQICIRNSKYVFGIPNTLFGIPNTVFGIPNRAIFWSEIHTDETTYT